MANTTFIRLFKSLADALYTKESPITTHFEYRGVQLLPDQELPYVQSTAHPTGVSLEDWTVKAYSLEDRELADLTEYFTVDRVFIDDYAQPQIDWSLTDVPFDFGAMLVYLKITQTEGEDFYTNIFQITANGSEYTTRFDYRDLDTDTMQSVQLQTWFRQKINEDELTKYYEVSTNNTVTKALKRSTPHKYLTDLFSNELLITFRNMLTSRVVYADLTRASLYKAFEMPELSARENFAEATYLLTFNNSDTYDPLYIAPVVPPVTTIPINVRGGVRGTGIDTQSWYTHFQFQTLPGYDTAVFAFSSVQINGVSVNFNPVFAVENDGLITLVSESTMSSIVVGQIHLYGFTIRVSNGTSATEYVFSGEEVYTLSDINNGIVKTISAQITVP